eukprot:CAMPEP_0172830330 /NCGR_PEP_ID=MMETSP1075-20121228/22180_1 /TAXON_ID=2916 /ORGANISM="Ceratium fusus, Strain PA161109" /LENGTH=34 /DNA_ID= /DNA_START= /DNA_END= /DNA_ORIENTATION=
MAHCGFPHAPEAHIWVSVIRKAAWKQMTLGWPWH